MSPTFAESIIDTLRVAAQRIGIETPVTWSAASVTTAVLAGSFALFRLVYHRPSKRQSLPSESHEKKKMPQIAVKPQDGTVKVAEILIHPIKSCRGTSVQTAKYTPEGLENDRKWCIIDATTNTVITARDFPRMVLITPRIESNPSSAHGGSLVVTFPPNAPAECTEFHVPLQPSADTLKGWEIIDKIGLFDHHVDGYIGQSLPSPSSSAPSTSASEILSRYFGKPVHLVYKGPRARAVDATHAFPDLQATSVFQDMYPLLVLSKESMCEVEREVRKRVGEQGVDEMWREERVELRRFRPNIVFEGGGPFAEDQWEEVAIGRTDAPVITLVSKCARCLLPNVSPETGVRDKAVPYKVIMKFRTGVDPIDKMKPCVGCNGVPAADGVMNGGVVQTPFQFSIFILKVSASIGTELKCKHLRSEG
ncbi:putative MOSC domain containing protein [Lyophyllum shimeji]|uniref:MOSC domain containing protein n=1 Tax=Lyophyllum shimeji TaxID=47721 RepID=A0A9P3PVB7_LYOSH|nr:putative MOSC domain containing protein [Lyophyllum shimeji]